MPQTFKTWCCGARQPSKGAPGPTVSVFKECVSQKTGGEELNIFHYKDMIIVWGDRHV